MQGVKAEGYTLEKLGYANGTNRETHALWSLELFQKDVPFNIAYLLNSEVVDTVFLAAFQVPVFQEKTFKSGKAAAKPVQYLTVESKCWLAHEFWSQ